MKYDADYFIKKFSEIDEWHWCIGVFTQEVLGGQLRCCALGHCGQRKVGYQTNESEYLIHVLQPIGLPSMVNDGDDLRYPQPTPKARILAALKDAKEAGR